MGSGCCGNNFIKPLGLAVGERGEGKVHPASLQRGGIAKLY